ncbi:MAG: hypothetical protein WD646_03925 [Actinomycetota bacterium]
MAETPRPPERSSIREWLRRYPPLVTFVAAVLIMLVIMPSALNLPQANPTTVLEYAPIPPEDEDPPPQSEGSLSSLGLGTSDTVTTEAGGLAGDIPLPGPPGEAPIVKRCVGDPPRQTEDLNSPPCVPFFQGDNGGTTWRGVTKDEITIVVYVDGNTLLLGGDGGAETSPGAGTICDIDSTPNDPDNAGCINGEGTEDHFNVAIVRTLAKYFNDRFQTYNRRAHFYIYWGTLGGSTTDKRSDAQDLFEQLRPFAVIDYSVFGEAEAFIEAMVKRGVSVYGSYALLENRIFRENAPFLWSFWPDVEHQVALFHDYVCKRVAPFPVGHTGVAEDRGKERKYGFLSTTDPLFEGQQAFAKLAKARLRRGCPNGAELDVVGEYTYPRDNFSTDTHPDAIAKAQENIQRMQADGVTSILWLGGYETAHSKASNSAGWFPEWIVAGDVGNDQTEEAGEQDETAWQYARIMSNQLREDKTADVPCRQAFREGNPTGSSADEVASCGVYRSFFMLFRGIQVAGPFLTPDAVDQGNHTIPRRESDNPYIASCFFDPGDYTCVKDAQESWWDATAPDPNNNVGQRGCWRMSDGGQRHLAGRFVQADGAFKRGPNVPCNAPTDNTSNINPYGPAG